MTDAELNSRGEQEDNMAIKSLLTILFIACTLSQSEPEKGWRGIIPLVTTRADVEKLLGGPMPGEQGYVLTYDTKDERVTIWYAGAKPSTLEPCKWNVPLDTVIRFIIALKIKKPLSEAKLDLAKYKRTVELDAPKFIYYSKEDKSLILETELEDGVERILSYDFQPTETDKRAKCILNQKMN